MNPKQRNALFRELHKSIEEAAVAAVSELVSGDVDFAYPPNAGLTPAEQLAIKQMQLSPELQSALRKVIADAAAAPLFTLFVLIDGVGDPSDYDEDWPVFVITEGEEAEPAMMLHDELLESYWTWREVRPEKRWRLDTYEG